MSIGFYLDEFEEEAFKCKHEECPYKACLWHRYCLEEQDRDDYIRKYIGFVDIFPFKFEDTEECTLYLDQ